MPEHNPNDARLIAKRDEIQAEINRLFEPIRERDKAVDAFAGPVRAEYYRVNRRQENPAVAHEQWLRGRIRELEMQLLQVEIHRLNEAHRRKNFQLKALRASERAACQRTHDAERAMADMMETAPGRLWEWTPAEERLPQAGVAVLVINGEGKVSVGHCLPDPMSTSRAVTYYWWSPARMRVFSKVTHWMPIPGVPGEAKKP